MDTRDSIVVAPHDDARHLILLFHGVAATAATLEPLAKLLARRCAPAWVVSVCAPFGYDRGRGRQWFSVRGVTESNRAARAAAAMPLFVGAVKHWQAEAGLGLAATTLVGFSQGAIMSLESMHSAPRLAARMVAIAGRFASDPLAAPPSLTVHLIHGDQDTVIACALSQRAYERLMALGGQVTLDVIRNLGHIIDEQVIERVLHRMGG